MRENLNSLSILFTDNMFRIPDYQRGYAWLERQLEDFWDDIVKLGEKEKHYTGTLSLQTIPESDYSNWKSETWVLTTRDYRGYYVVDGQQRLTTCILLIQSILENATEGRINDHTLEKIREKYIYTDKEGGVARCYIFGYDEENPSYNFLKSAIFNQQVDAPSQLEETVYTENLKFAKEFFLSRISELSREELEIVFRKLTQNLVFNVYLMDKELDVFVSFETMNNRGKALSHLELLKNRLIYLSTKIATDTEDSLQLRANINSAWRSVYYYLGKYKDRPLDDDLFLYSHFTLYFQSTMADEYYFRFGARRDIAAYHKEYLLDIIFSAERLHEAGPNGEPKITIHSLNKYVQSLQKYVRIWFNILNPEKGDLDLDERLWLTRLNRLDMEKYSTLLLALYGRKPSKRKTVAIFKSIEKMEFLRSLRGYNRGILPASFNLSAREYYKNAIDADEVLLRIETKISEMTRGKNIAEIFAITAGKHGYYRWNLVRYFLYEYEYYLQGRSKTNTEKIDPEEFFSWSDNLQYGYSEYKTIEHIYPQTARRECWTSIFSAFTTSERERLRNSLGNLLALSQPKNSALSNNCFDSKKSNGDSLGYIYGSYSENQVGEAEVWDAKAIKDRGLKMVDFLLERFEIGQADERTKLKILGIENISIT